MLTYCKGNITVAKTILDPIGYKCPRDKKIEGALCDGCREVQDARVRGHINKCTGIRYWHPGGVPCPIKNRYHRTENGYGGASTLCPECLFTYLVDKEMMTTASVVRASEKSRQRTIARRTGTCKDELCNQPDKIQALSSHGRCKECTDTRAKMTIKLHAKRRQCVKGFTPVKDMRQLIKLCGPKCLKCKTPYDGVFGKHMLEIDHIVPASYSWRYKDPRATNWIINLQPLCWTCNRSKGNRETKDYRPLKVRRLARKLYNKEIKRINK